MVISIMMYEIWRKWYPKLKIWSSSAPLEVTLSVELPESVTTAQGVSSDITFAVYAIQANAPAADANAWLAGQIG